MSVGVLRQVQQRLAGWLVARTGLSLVAAAGTAALGWLFSDAALDLPELARLTAPWLVGLVVVGVLGVGLWQWRRLDQTRIARQFESLQPGLGNRLTNAVQLSQHSGASNVEEFLRCEAVELGRKTAADLATWPLMRRGLLLSGVSAGAILLAWVLIGRFGMDMLGMEWPRFADACGDHPPFSKVHFKVTPKRGEVLYGGQLEVRAKTSGSLADKLWLVTRSGSNTTRTVMFLAPDKSFFQSLANLREPTEYFVTDGQARSHRFPIQILYTPQITLVEVTTEFPAYTGKPLRTSKLTENPPALPADTRVSFRVTSNRPLRSGALRLEPVLGGKVSEVSLAPAETTPPSADNISPATARNSTVSAPAERVKEPPHVVTGSFVLAEPVFFSLVVRDLGGLECAQPWRGRFNILPDEPPRLAVLEPGRNAVATPAFKVPIRIQATDDYGISRVAWLRGHNRSIERPFDMKFISNGGPASVESTGTFELEKLGVRPGDVIEYYFEAADNDPKGPNVAVSRLYRLEIISEEQYKQVLQRAAARKTLFEAYMKTGAWLRRLAERARDVEARAARNDSQAASEAMELQEQLKQYDAQLSKLLQSPPMFDVEDSFRDTLREQQQRIGSARQKLNNALAGGKPDARQLRELSEELRHLSEQEQEQVSQPAQQIASVVAVLARADAFVNLAQQQATLAQMLRRFAETTNALSRAEQMELQELAHQQRRIEEALKTLTLQLPELLSKVPDAPQYGPLKQDVQEFLQAVEEARIGQDLANAAQALADSKATTGHPLAQRAAENMDKLVGKCNAMPQQGQQCLTARFRPKLQKPGLGKAVSQILAAMNSGNGQGGRDGYGLFSDDVSLYGPNVELAGEQAGGQSDEGKSGARQFGKVNSGARQENAPVRHLPGRVRLQPDAKFPLRYRELVGEYFRAIAETTEEEGGKR